MATSNWLASVRATVSIERHCKATYREWSTVHQARSTFEGLNEVRLDRIAQQDSDCTGNAQVFAGDRLWNFIGRVGDGNLSDTFAGVGQIRTNGQDDHQLTGHCHVELSAPSESLLLFALTDGDLSQETVVGVQNTVPFDVLCADVQTRELAYLFRCQIVRIGISRNAQLIQTFLLNFAEDALLARLFVGTNCLWLER